MTAIWSEHFTKEGRVYYYNRVTKQSAWEKPADFDGQSTVGKDKKAGGAGATAFEWEELWDPKNQRYYYFNRSTRKTQWAKPENVAVKPCTNHPGKKDKDKKTDAASSSTSSSGEAAAGTNTAATTTKAAAASATAGGGHSTKGGAAAQSDAGSSKKDTHKGDEEGRTTSHRTRGGTPRGRNKGDDHKAEHAGHDTARKHKKEEVAAAAREEKAHKSEAKASDTTDRDDPTADDGEDDDDDLDDGMNGTDASGNTKKRKKKEKRKVETPSSLRKKRRQDSHEKRMIICDDEDRMNKENARAIQEKDTEDGKEATRLLQELSKTDSIMEVNVLGVINGFLRAHNESNGPEILVEKLSSSYRGHAQMVGLLASWMDALPVSKSAMENKITFDVTEGAVKENKGATWSPAEDIMYEHLKKQIKQHYEPKLLSNVLSGSAVEPEWLKEMLRDKHWRMMLIELAEQHKTCNLLQYAIRRISEAGHHKEIASITNADAFFPVFNGVLADAFCRIPFASEEEVREDLLALKKVCCHSAYSFLYTSELLCALDRKFYQLQQEATASPRTASRYRMIRSKLDHVRYELQETAIDKFASKVEAFHPLRRRYLYDANPNLNEAILSIIRTKKCSEWAADVLVKEYKGVANPPPVALLRDPLVLRSFLDPLFNPSETIAPGFGGNCSYLLAYSASTRDERGVLHMQKKRANDKPSTAIEVHEDDIQRTNMALNEASAICKSDNTLGYNMNSSGVVEKLVSAMETPVVSMGVLHWLEVMLRSPTFFNSTLLHICFPSLLRILKAAIKLHMAQWPVTFRVLVIALRLRPDVNPVKALELKRETLRSMVFLITSGYVLPVLEFIFTNTMELDQALLRNFVTVLFARVRPPYSAKLVTALSNILTHPKVQNAIKTCPPDCKEKLRNFVGYCRKNPALLSAEQLQALAFGLETQEQ